MKNYMFLLIGLMGFILTEPVISQSISSEQEEQSLKSFRYTMTHKDWESLVISAKGKISSPLTVKIKTDTAKLKKVKKIAIISFNVYDWSKSDKSIN
ncbi:MAG: hypothetical protein N2662_08835, partial [Bacteroidales bacterium]|nr:hypothetical protein [Bacteroidales bacterium]